MKNGWNIKDELDELGKKIYLKIYLKKVYFAAKIGRGNYV